MKDGTKEWDMDLINQIFFPFDAEEIKKIRIPVGAVEDHAAWHFEKSGAFTVKSAYKLAADLKASISNQASNSTSEAGDRRMWDLIWKTKVPNKIKVFAWRVATGTLATKRNKYRRTITHDGMCTICGREEEDEFHAVVTCTKSTALRHAMRMCRNLPSEKSFRRTGEDWLQVLLDACTEEVRINILLLFWRSWHLRDNCIHGEGKETIMGSVNFLRTYAEEISVMHGSDQSGSGDTLMSLFSEQTSRPMLVVPSRWVAPPQGVVKLNTDASFQMDSGRSTVGAVARDSKGGVLVSISRQIGACCCVEEAEAAAVLAGLSALQAVYRGDLLIETDCSAVAKELKSGSAVASVCYPWIHDINEMAKMFRSVQVEAVRRTCNGLAHELAALAKTYGNQEIIADVPGAVRELWLTECNHNAE